MRLRSRREQESTSSQSGATDWPDVTIIGSYPPPYGGVSVHIQRLVGRLAGAGLRFRVLNTLSASAKPPHVDAPALPRVARALYVPWFVGLALTDRSKVLHMNSMNWLAHVLLAIFGGLRGRRTVLSLHSAATESALRSRSSLVRRLTIWTLRRIDVVVASNPFIASYCLEEAGLAPESVRVIPAFIPPGDESQQALNPELERFLADHDPLLSAVGWIGHKFDGEDVYGLDLLTDLTESLMNDHPRLGMVFCVNGGDAHEIESAVKQVSERLGNAFRFETELTNVLPVLRSSLIFLRPTNTDGDAVSIREALHVGTPVIASDAVPRPSAVELFGNRNLADLRAKVERHLADGAETLQRRVEREAAPFNAADELLKLYEELLD